MDPLPYSMTFFSVPMPLYAWVGVLKDQGMTRASQKKRRLTKPAYGPFLTATIINYFSTQINKEPWTKKKSQRAKVKESEE
jgi:hypothetical protein